MKMLLALFLLCSSALPLVGEGVLRFVFPPFGQEKIELLTRPLTYPSDFEELNALSVETLRGFMTAGGISDQLLAATELMKRGDQETILRVVYSLKQGNAAAEELLRGTDSLDVIPYLMEDVAHGSLEYYGAFHPTFSVGRVRVVATECVAAILAESPVFSGENRECLRAITSGNESEIQTLTQQSRYLVQWWLLNERAFEAGKWEDIRPLLHEITYIHPRDDTPLPSRDDNVYLLDPALRPPIGGPELSVAESFEAWSARIVDPKRRNLDFVALSWDGKKVIEHPAVSLDPKAKLEDRQSRKSPTPRTSPDSESGDRRRGISWIVAAVVLMLALSIARWLRRRPSTGT